MLALGLVLRLSLTQQLCRLRLGQWKGQFENHERPLPLQLVSLSYHSTPSSAWEGGCGAGKTSMRLGFHDIPNRRLRGTIFTTEFSGRFMPWERPHLKANPVGGSASKKMALSEKKL